MDETPTVPTWNAPQTKPVTFKERIIKAQLNQKMEQERYDLAITALDPSAFRNRRTAIMHACILLGFTELLEEIAQMDSDKKLMDTMKDVCGKLLCARFNNSTGDGHCGICGRAFENHCVRLGVKIEDFMIVVGEVLPYFAKCYNKYLINIATEKQKINENIGFYEKKVHFIRELRKMEKFHKVIYEEYRFMWCIATYQNWEKIVAETKDLIEYVMTPEVRISLQPEDRYVHDDDCELANKLVELCPELSDFYQSLYANAQVKSESDSEDV